MSSYSLIEKDFEAWVAGDDRAFEIIFEHFYPQFYVLAQKVTNNNEVAEELGMNAMMKIWQLRNNTDNIQRIDVYLFGILRQQIAGFLRKKILKTVSLEGLDEAEQPICFDSVIPYKELLEFYYAAIEKLSPQQKKIFLMSREEHLSNQEVGDRLGLSVHTINNHIKASLKVIKAEFDDVPAETISFVIFTVGLTCRS